LISLWSSSCFQHYTTVTAETFDRLWEGVREGGGEMVVNGTPGRWVLSEDRFYSHWTSWTKTPDHWFRFLCAAKGRPTLLV